MARIRTIKPEFFRHESLQELAAAHGAHVMLVFAGLWGHCDRAGRFECRPRQLKLDILPFLDFDMAETIGKLEGAGFLQTYDVDGKRYGFIPSFSEHQRFGGREAAEPAKYPEPPVKQVGSNWEKSGSTWENSGSNWEKSGSNGEATSTQVGKAECVPNASPNANSAEVSQNSWGSNGEAIGKNPEAVGKNPEAVGKNPEATGKQVVPPEREWNKGKGKGKGKEDNSGEQVPPLPEDQPEDQHGDHQGSAEEDDPYGFGVDEAAMVGNSWNGMAEENGLPTINRMTSGRRQKILARAREVGLVNLILAIERVPDQPFLLGRNERGWRIDFDWLLEPRNFVKVEEQKFRRVANGHA